MGDRIESHPPLDVRRVEHDRGSDIEPPLDPAWDELTKLRWHAGVVLADTGHAVHIVTGGMSVKTILGWRRVPGVYGLRWSSVSSSGGSFDYVWAWLNGYSSGATEQRRKGR